MLINYQFRNILSSHFLLILHESFLNEDWADKEIVSLTPYTYMSILTGVIVFMFDLRRELWYLLKPVKLTVHDIFWVQIKRKR